MKPALSVSCGSVVVAFCVVMAPGSASAQHRGADTGGGGAAVSIGSSSGGSSSGGSSSSSGSGDSTPASSSSSSGSSFGGFGHRTPNTVVPPTPASANTNSGAFTNYSNLTFPAPEFAQPRSSLGINTAFPKGTVPILTPKNNNLTFIVGAYNPWLYAYDGLYGLPFYGVFDPFLADFGYAGPQVWTTTTTPAKDEKGVLNLDIKPRDAEVYVDGGLVGRANNFIGLFHKLRLEAGVHRLELRAPGYEPITVNVRIQAGESMTYRGALEKLTQ